MMIRLHLNNFVHYAHTDALKAGWWEGVDINDINVVPTKLCLIHSEISEAMEGHRKNLMDEHLPHRKMLEVELADAMIRIADLAGMLGYDLGGAIKEKMDYNKNRNDHKRSERSEKNGKSY